MKRQLISILSGLLLSSCVVAENLQQTLEKAEKYDATYKVAVAAWEAQQENRTLARSFLLPTINLTAGTSWTDMEVTGSSSPAIAKGDVQYNENNYQLGLNLALYHHDFIIAYQQAGIVLKQSDLDLHAAEQDLLFRVADAYFAVLGARDSLRFTQSEKKAIARQLDQTQQRFKVGLIAITDVHEAQAAFDLSVAGEISAENGLASSYEALRVITGEENSDLSEMKANVVFEVPEPQEIDQWADMAAKNNLVLLSTDLASQVAKKEVKRVRAGHLPTVDLYAGYGSSKSGSPISVTESDAWSVGVRATIPLFAGGRVMSQTRQAEHRYQQSIEAYEAVRRDVLRQTRDAYRGITASISSAKALYQARLSSNSALEATEAGFEVGTRTIVDVLNAQRDLFRAKSNYAAARYAYVLRVLQLKRAAGILTRDDVITVSSWLK